MTKVKRELDDYIVNDKRVYQIINGVKWANILGHKGYWVSEKGEVKSKTGRILKHSLTIKGYPQISIKNKDKIRTYRIHRLVALAFIPNPNNLPQVNHIDCNKHNNHVNNLEWCTDEENRSHKLANNLNVTQQGTDHKLNKIDEKAVEEIFFGTESIKYYIDKYNISKSLVYGIRSGRNWGWYTKRLKEKRI